MHQGHRLALVLLHHDSPSERGNVHPDGAHWIAAIVDVRPVPSLAQDGTLHHWAQRAAHRHLPGEGGARVEAQGVHDHRFIADAAADHHFSRLAQAGVVAEHLEDVVVIELENQHADQRPVGNHRAGGEPRGVLESRVEPEVGHFVLEQRSRAVEDVGQLGRSQLTVSEIHALSQTPLQAEQDRAVGFHQQHVRVPMGAGNVRQNRAMRRFGLGIFGRRDAVSRDGSRQLLACPDDAGGVRHRRDAADSLGSVRFDLGRFLFCGNQQRAVNRFLDRALRQPVGNQRQQRAGHNRDGQEPEGQPVGDFQVEKPVGELH